MWVPPVTLAFTLPQDQLGVVVQYILGDGACLRMSCVHRLNVANVCDTLSRMHVRVMSITPFSAFHDTRLMLAPLLLAFGAGLWSARCLSRLVELEARHAFPVRPRFLFAGQPDAPTTCLTVHVRGSSCHRVQKKKIR